MEASVSVIIPCYRCSNTIERAVDSVARQTLRPAEVILVEDDSGDGTLEKLKELQQQYGKEWIKVVALESNSGPSIARNAGWDLASQDYIAFLDADDAWHPEKIAIQYSWMLANHQASVSGHAYDVIQISYRDLSLNYDTIKSDFIAYLVNTNKILLTNPFVTPSIMLKRKIDYRFDPSKKYAEDHFLWMEICLDGYELYHLNINATFVFKTSGSLSSNKLYMRYGGIINYLDLWKRKKISLLTMLFYVQYTSLKAFLSILFPKLHLFLRRKSELFLFNLNSK
jgi:glycosyltransferase involved in cell wall biosynthesis